MRNRLTLILGVLALISPLFLASAVSAQTPGQPDAAQADAAQVVQQQGDTDQADSQDTQTPARVARVFAIQGSVSFQRAGDSDWYDAAINLPLLAGDQIYAGPGARAIIQLDRSIFIALGQSTDLSISQLDDSTGQFEIPSGSAVIEAAGLKSAFDLLEVDTPVSSVVVNLDGLYRVDVGDDGGTVAMVQAGSADVASADGGVTLGAGKMAQVGPSGSGLLQSSNLSGFDDLGLGESNSSAGGLAQAGPPGAESDQSGAAYPPSPDYVSTYENTYDGLYGADELSAYGTWTYYSSYGNIWLPAVAAAWAPFRSGRWIFIKQVGWTWLPTESWGWVTSHHGRWAFITGLGWAWIPGFGPGRPAFVTGPSYYKWRPAVVAFFNGKTPTTNLVAWAPLSPSEKWQRQTSTFTARPVSPSRTANFTKGLSVMPLAAFEGGIVGSPAAPGPELRTIVAGPQPIVRRRTQHPESGLLAGLGTVHPGKAAISPLAPGATHTTATVRPPVFVLSRPIVTRHMPSGAVARGAIAARQRTLLKATPAPLMSNSRADSDSIVGKVAPKHTFVKGAKTARTGPAYAGVGHPTDRAVNAGNTSEGGNSAREGETTARGEGNGGVAAGRATGSNAGASATRTEGSGNSGEAAGQPARTTERPVRSAGAPPPQHDVEPPRSAAPMHSAPPSSGTGGGKH